MNTFSPGDDFLGGYTPTDGTIEFYGRVKSLLKSTDRVLDLGAGRGAWYEDDPCSRRRDVRTLKGHAREVIGADVDEAVLENRSTDRNIVIRDRMNLQRESVDLVVADYVLEHIEHPKEFVDEIARVLVSGGVFCARTPHKFHYVSLGARLINNTRHSRVLASIQPNRRPEDVFPTAYRLNTLREIRRAFLGFDDFTYLYRSDPAYFWGKRSIYQMQRTLQYMTPKVFSGNIFVFLVKK